MVVDSGFFFFKQKTAYEMRISDWSSDVCSSDLAALLALRKRSTASTRAMTPGNFLSAAGSAPTSHKTQRRSPCRNSCALMNGLTNGDRNSVVSGKSVSVRVELGGRRRIKKKKKMTIQNSKKNKKI